MLTKEEKKVKHAAYMREYYWRNPEKSRKERRENAAKPENREHNLAYHAKKYAENPAHRAAAIARAIKWQADNREHRKAYLKAYHAKKKNGDKARARTIAWMKANPEKKRAHGVNYAGRRRQRIGKSTKSEIKAVAAIVSLEQAKRSHRCYYCQYRFSGVFHVDHVIPLVSGGRHEAGNIAIACPACNLSKAAKSTAEVVSGGQPLLAV